MRLLTLLLIAAGPVRPSDALIPGAETFDLSTVKPARSCEDARSDAITVCGHRAKNDVIVVSDPGRFETGPLVAETGLGSGARLDVHAEQRSLPNGQSAPAAMIRIRTPF